MLNQRLHAASLCFALAALCASTACTEPPKLDQEQYKRIHLKALEAIVDGNAKGAFDALIDYDKEHPRDPETAYTLAVACIQLGHVDPAVQWAKAALDRSLPPGRFLAGPRRLLKPLIEHEKFQELVDARRAGPIHGPMLGRVTDHSALVWVRTADETPVTLTIGASEDLADARILHPVIPQADRDYTAIIAVDDLESDTRYYYTVATQGQDPAPTKHSFPTFPVEGQPAQFRIGFGGGAGFVPPHEYVWNTIRDLEPTAFLFLGDNVYIDHPEYPDLQQYCYYRRQSRPEYRRFVSGAAVYAIYDDHDFGDNDCWGGPDIDSPAWKRDVWRRFTHNWVNPSYGGHEAQPGCWFEADIADVHFFFLDCRYYRTNPKQPNPSMLGPVQKQWFLDRLEQTDATFNVLVSSVPWAKNTKPGSLDTWDGYDAEREEILSHIEQRQVPGVVLLSADRHRSDAWTIERKSGHTFYEFESSRLTNQHVHPEMPAALYSYNDTQSFGIIDFDTTKPDPELTYRIYSIDGKEVYHLTLTQSQLTPR